jgi:hypothetical protein
VRNLINFKQKVEDNSSSLDPTTVCVGIEYARAMISSRSHRQDNAIGTVA